MKDDSISISPVDKIYELMFCIRDLDGSCNMESVKLNLENTTLEEAISKTVKYYPLAISAELFVTDVYEDKDGKKYFSEIEYVRNVTI